MDILNSCVKMNTQLSADLLYTLGRLTEDHAYALSDGWRAIIKIQEADAAEPYFLIDAQSELGGGDFAETKMRMLELYPGMVASGLDVPEEFVKRLETSLDLFTEEQREAFTALADNIAAVSRNEHLFGPLNETLRERLGVTTYRGAIRVPYELICGDENGVLGKHYGEIRIAFSGAKEWQDMFFVCQLLDAFQHYARSAWRADQLQLRLGALRQDSQYAMWLNLLKIKNI